MQTYWLDTSLNQTSPRNKLNMMKKIQRAKEILARRLLLWLGITLFSLIPDFKEDFKQNSVKDSSIAEIL